MDPLVKVVVTRPSATPGIACEESVYLKAGYMDRGVLLWGTR